jgi:ribosomal protein S18 acetylase RimI-like enzyme
MMRGQNQDVIPLRPSEMAQAGMMLGRAFQDDPMWMALMPEPDARSGMLATMFTALARTTPAARGVAEKTPDIHGVALWLAPGRDIGLWGMAKSGFALARFTMGLPGHDRKRMLNVLRQVDDRKQDLMPRPHWYLSAIGVDPMFQGEGVGSTLLQHGIARADSGKHPIYLETATQGNVEFYLSHDFTLLEELALSDLGVPLWLMAREAGSPSTR